VSEVDIIGGSAAGLFAAYLLACGGKSVRLFDANDVLHVDSRTLITTSRLADVLGFFPQEAVVNKIDQIDLYSPSRFVSIPMKEPDLVVERSAVIRILAQKALDAGVEIRGGCKLQNLIPGDHGVTVTIKDIHRDRIETFTTKTLIGADGMYSRVAKSTIGNGHPTTPLLQAIVELPRGARSGTTAVWFEPEDTPYFYWSIPQSPHHAAVGFIAEEGKDARSKLERFLNRMGFKAVEMQSARIPSYAHFIRPWQPRVGSNIYLIGDAAAQVKVTTVGGLVTGLRGAKAAANAILYGGNYLKELRPLRRELSLHLLIRTAMHRFRGEDYDRLLGLFNERMIELLGVHNRDHAGKIIWRMFLAQPRLLSFASIVSRRLPANRFRQNRLARSYE
jgi:flavin-dependent dehydrogenase